MNLLIRALIEKAGRDNGFENAILSGEGDVVLSSAQHRAVVKVTPNGQQFLVYLEEGPAALANELDRHFQSFKQLGGDFCVSNEPLLAQWLRKSASLARSLPNQVMDEFERQVKSTLTDAGLAVLGDTEVERIVRQRVGQDRFRSAMLDYWGSACAVTGLTLKQALRASHAKPWADCKSDVERLNVFNGFLLSANLDALFDKFLISFDEDGRILISDSISAVDRCSLGLHEQMQLRWMAVEHRYFIDYHRDVFLRNVALQLGRDVC